MASLTNAIRIIRSVRGNPDEPPLPLILTRAQISDILERTFNKPKFINWHRRKQRWIYTGARCSPIWLSRLKTLTANVADHLLEALHKGDILAFWTDGWFSFPINDYATPRALINSALDSLENALSEFCVISANLDSFKQQFDPIRGLFFDYLRQSEDDKTWFCYQSDFLEYVDGFEFDLDERYPKTIKEQGDRSLNGVIMPSDKMLRLCMAAEPTFPTFVKQEGVYGGRLVKIEKVPKGWSNDWKKMISELERRE
ncbi:hypothetical protein ACMFMG_009598 [Clarireedia jacksonii]